jgi:AAHS family benzoate transporter-like MFS transporter
VGSNFAAFALAAGCAAVLLLATALTTKPVAAKPVVDVLAH